MGMFLMYFTPMMFRVQCTWGSEVEFKKSGILQLLLKENKINVAFMEVMEPLNPTTVTTYDLWMIESILKRHLTQYLIVNVVSKSSSAKLDFGCSSDTVSG